MTSPSGRGTLAMTLTIPLCSRATRSRLLDKTLPSIVILLWMVSTNRNWRQLIHQIYLTQFPFIVLYSPTDLSIVRKGTHNYQPSPFVADTVNVWEWWCDNGKC